MHPHQAVGPGTSELWVSAHLGVTTATGERVNHKRVYASGGSMALVCVRGVLASERDRHCPVRRAPRGPMRRGPMISCTTVAQMGKLSND
jgi:hypothetical protein